MYFISHEFLHDDSLEFDSKSLCELCDTCEGQAEPRMQGIPNSCREPALHLEIEDIESINAIPTLKGKAFSYMAIKWGSEGCEAMRRGLNKSIKPNKT
jgi:hypothetical protein